ncbi:TRAP transporter small permease [Aliarcobacter lanthieri]|uniref:TRAP transporter small permease n=1 Tax=Arcobacteraceae TaxID=2808963 RepID=UPI000479455D|nr:MULTISPECIES: TRAP transporter small permease [Arcobacteraceae]MBL3520504.1 TRAP transporter small permease [Aliarcobacter lanthieri]QKF58545.1 TRAP transporter, small permease subunit [Aliarcobacter lanthieri]RBQ27434.1 TRAP transporter small permease [Arcobacter sp. CECT 9188]
MDKFFKIMDVIVGTINQTIAVYGMVLGVLLAFVNVILRYAFGTSLPWAGELTQYLFIWSALFGAAYGFRQGAHISITLLISKLSPVLTKTFLVFANLLSISYLLLISYLGYQLILMLMDFGEINVDLQIPMWIPQLVIPIAFLLAAYRVFEKLVELLRTDSKDIKVFSEHEHIVDEIKGEK